MLVKRVLVQLSDSANAQLTRLAIARNQPPSRLAGELLEEQLTGLTPLYAVPASAAEEAELMAWVVARAELLKDEDSWGQHVTRELFEMIETEIPEIYAAATPSDSAKKHVNAKIGALLRRTLGAEVVTLNGRRRTGHPLRRNRALITTYSLLVRPSK